MARDWTQGLGVVQKGIEIGHSLRLLELDQAWWLQMDLLQPTLALTLEVPDRTSFKAHHWGEIFKTIASPTMQAGLISVEVRKPNLSDFLHFKEPFSAITIRNNVEISPIDDCDLILPFLLLAFIISQIVAVTEISSNDCRKFFHCSRQSNIPAKHTSKFSCHQRHD